MGACVRSRELSVSASPLAFEIEECPETSRVEMLTPQNCATALIDYQSAMYQGIQCCDRLVVLSNTQVLAKTARLIEIRTVLSTVAENRFSGLRAGSHRPLC